MSGNDSVSMTISKGPRSAEEAAEWLARMTSGHMDDAQMLGFARWIEDPANADAYNHAEMLWLALDDALERGDNVVELRPRARRFQWLDRRFAAMAASLAIALGGAYQYVAVWQYDHATQGAETASVDLADGSRVELNTDSALDYEFKDGVRHVTLAKGEAFFDVKRDPAHPFVVDAGGAEVRVLGTAFSVRRGEDGGAVVVQRGKVRVTTANGRVDLTPDRQVSYRAGTMGAVRAADAGKALAWSRGVLIIEDEPLGNVLAQLDRYYPGIIRLSDAKVGKARVNAVIEIDRIDDWLAALRKSHDVEVRFFPGLTVVG